MLQQISLLKPQFYPGIFLSKAFKVSPFPVESSLPFIPLLSHRVLSPHGNLHFVIHFTFLWWQTEVYDLIHSAGQPCLLLLSGRLGKPKREAARSLGSESQAKHFLEMYFLY